MPLIIAMVADLILIRVLLLWLVSTIGLLSLFLGIFRCQSDFNLVIRVLVFL